jgi:hypothetical protein
MLTLTEYNDLWATTLGTLGIPNTDTYVDYCERECYFQDYLDLFRGVNTRAARVCACPNPHPYLKDLGTKKREIKYVLIAEAPTSTTYFYNPTHSYSAYFWEPYTALIDEWQERDLTLSKLDLLIKFADKGVLLLDLFPYAIDYNPIRDSIIQNRLHLNYWESDIEINPYSARHRILGISKLMARKVKACLIAPPKISHHLAYAINSFSANNGLVFQNGYTMSNGVLKSDGRYFCKERLGAITTINNLIPNDGTNLTLSTPFYACCAYSGSGTVPHHFFIKNALRL